jgi:hypothetical protein
MWGLFIGGYKKLLVAVLDGQEVGAPGLFVQLAKLCLMHHGAKGFDLFTVVRSDIAAQA